MKYINLNLTTMKRFLSLVFLLVSMAIVGSAQTVKGDMNGDGVLNITDVTAAVNVILGRQAQEQIDLPTLLKWKELTFTSDDGTEVVVNGNLLESVTGNAKAVKGDMNGDGVLNITDVTAAVNVILGRQQQEEITLFDLLKGLTLNFSTVNGSDVTVDGNRLTAIKPCHEYVDLGLPSGTKWATVNVGADKPEELGNYFTVEKTYRGPRKEYGVDSLEYGGDLGGGGKEGILTELIPAEDAACVNWGSEWRIPSKTQFEELRNVCTWTWTERNGVSGYLVVGVNGNSIFLPAAGYGEGSLSNGVGGSGNYWTRSLDTENTGQSWYAYFSTDGLLMQSKGRDCWLSVRPVRSNTVTHEYVDLGLTSGTLWATTNVGADFAEEYGEYFAWGETEGYDSCKKSYTWKTYKYCEGSNKTMTKYCSKEGFGYNGFTDGLAELEASDDAATANWGEKWQTPSDEQWTELRTECTWTWTKQNNVNGYLVSSRSNGNAIFLPAAGYRYNNSYYDAGSSDYFWSRTLNTETPYNAYGIYFNNRSIFRNSYIRHNGQSVRPVRKK